MKGIYNLARVLAGLLFLSGIICSLGGKAYQREAFWVSPTGAATWATAKSETPLSGTACCSMSTANANASAGDTVYLR
ncbi:MAG: hypothetical protein IMZ61_09920, partial [Planctomycetes bacterium]|nr:hypothetical protein [Planctomycetota bacterium]